MIQVQNISKSFQGKAVVSDISFEVGESETLVLLGVSGSGKTTTLKMINRLIEPDQGTVRIDGADIGTQPVTTLRKNIGYVIQHVGLFPHYTVEENIALVPSLLRWDKKKISGRVHELMDMVGMSPNTYLKRKPDMLSGGQRQRIGIARALAADPSLILMDEPFGALDPITRKQLRGEFKSMKNILKKTVVLVTHDVLEAFQLADRICLIDQGKVQQVGTPKELIFNPANLKVEDFFREYQLQLQMEALTLEDVGEHLKEPLPPALGQETIHTLLNDEDMLRQQAVDTQSVIEAFYAGREQYRA